MILRPNAPFLAAGTDRWRSIGHLRDQHRLPSCRRDVYNHLRGHRSVSSRHSVLRSRCRRSRAPPNDLASPRDPGDTDKLPIIACSLAPSTTAPRPPQPVPPLPLPAATPRAAMFAGDSRIRTLAPAGEVPEDSPDFPLRVMQAPAMSGADGSRSRHVGSEPAPALVPATAPSPHPRNTTLPPQAPPSGCLCRWWRARWRGPCAAR